MKTFICLSAIAGSGKSTWAKEYAKKHENVHIVSSDELRLELGGSYQFFEKEDEVWRRYSEDIQKYLKEDNVTVIADSTNIVNVHRIKYALETKNADKRILICFKKPLEEVLEHNRNREIEKFVPEYAIKNMYEKWEEPSEECKKLYDEVIEITGWNHI